MIDVTLTRDSEVHYSYKTPAGLISSPSIEIALQKFGFICWAWLCYVIEFTAFRTGRTQGGQVLVLNCSRGVHLPLEIYCEAGKVAISVNVGTLMMVVKTAQPTPALGANVGAGFGIEDGEY